MDPVYKNVQQYPYQIQKDQMNHGPYYYHHPGTEAAPPQMYMNPPRPPVNYGYCPWSSSYGYPTPIGCHGCCNHAHPPPHYAWATPYGSHLPPFHVPVNYPSFPVPYMPSYGVEQPQYGHENNLHTGHHCCGCSDHLFQPKEQNNVRIEEEEPLKERRKNDTLVPFQFKNGPHPIAWLPSGYGNDNERGKVKDSEDGKTVVQKPASWNGWYPLDFNNLVSSKHSGDGGINRPQNDGKGNFPFPLFWLPNYKPEEKEMEGHKGNDAILASQKDSGPGSEQSFHVTGEKETPVNEGKGHKEKEGFENREKETGASVKPSIGSGEKKLDNEEKKLPNKGDNRDAGKPASSKSSKLPPVCLRVDPLPRKKAGNGSSSRQGDKEKPSKVLNSSDNKERSEFKEKKGTKTIEVVDANAQKHQNAVVNVQIPIGQGNVLTNQKEEKPKKENISRGQSEDVGSALEKNEELLKDEAIMKSGKTDLSEEEAAVVIQSAYRGFDTRKWEPVKKLKEIAKVKEEIANVKHLIQEMEESAFDVEGSGKQRHIVAEILMSLLLKLDAIQGLHPSAREIRKSLVRELVTLQERLDSVTKNIKPENPLEEESVTRHDEDHLNKAEGVIQIESGNETPFDLKEVHQNHENTEVSETTENLENEAAENSLTKNGESASESTMKKEDERSNEVPQNDEYSILEEELVLEKGSKLPLLQNSASINATNLEQTDCHKLESDSAELPQGVPNDPYARDNINCRDGTSEQQTGTADEENVEITHEVSESDLPPSDVKLGLEAEEASPTHINESSACNKIGGDAEFFDPDQRRDQESQDDTVAQAKVEAENVNLEREMCRTNGSANTCEETADHTTCQVENEGPLEVTSDEAKDSSVSRVDSTPPRVPVIRDDMYESNRKLIEENQRLKDIMEKMIKSGQEQLTAISSLSGRVKDLERKLSRKKKLKLKKVRAK
ncbi:hypothetical protein ABFS83_14G137300 [Erythranthe nasuta]